MSKISVPATNNYCPQTLFLYGTYDEQKKPNFGLFCWLSYCWDKELKVMACIGDNKLTKDRIKKNGIFSANLVTEPLLPLADYMGSTSGYKQGKMDVNLKLEKGQMLDVPVLVESPVVFELCVEQFIPLEESSDILICNIKNLLLDEKLVYKTKTVEEKLKEIAPVTTTCSTYFSWEGNKMGKWGDVKEAFLKSQDKK